MHVQRFSPMHWACKLKSFKGTLPPQIVQLLQKRGQNQKKVNIFIALFGTTHSKTRRGEGQRSFAVTLKNALLVKRGVPKRVTSEIASSEK